MFVDKRRFDVHHVHHIEFDNAGDRVALMMHVSTKWNRHLVPLAQRVRVGGLDYLLSLVGSHLFVCLFGCPSRSCSSIRT